jgi:hypothetical protein
MGLAYTWAQAALISEISFWALREPNSLADHYPSGHGMSLCLEDQKAPAPQASPRSPSLGLSFWAPQVAATSFSSWRAGDTRIFTPIPGSSGRPHFAINTRKINHDKYQQDVVSTTL